MTVIKTLPLYTHVQLLKAKVLIRRMR